MIDLRSDTVSQPTEAMRQAILRAEVGDDVYGDDPSVLALERRTAELLGKEAAAFMPTGTMTNQVGLRAHTEAGDAILADRKAHIYTSEGGAPSGLSGLLVHPLMGRHGIFTAEDVLEAVPPRLPFKPSTLNAPVKLLCLENTHNGGGGVVWELDQVKDVVSAARSRGLKAHLDGARLWHAAVSTGTPLERYAEPFDSVSVCFSKGLGAPMGSALAGSLDFITRARRFKQMFGGGFRQAGLMAAAALYAVENHRDRLAEDHDKARRLAEGLARTAGFEIDLSLVQTNIVRFQLTSKGAPALARLCYEAGLYILPAGARAMRAVMHLGVAEEHVEEALAILRSAVGRVQNVPEAVT